MVSRASDWISLDDHDAVEAYVEGIVNEAREKIRAALDAEGLAHDDPRREPWIERAAAMCELEARRAIARFRCAGAHEVEPWLN